jgi:hypothetical protein
MAHLPALLHTEQEKEALASERGKHSVSGKSWSIKMDYFSTHSFPQRVVLKEI